MQSSSDHLPNQTLYLRNLTEKLNKANLRRQLFNMFSHFGPILDVSVQPGQRSRGQAWIVFADVEGATKALTKMQAHVFFDKPMTIQFAAAKSDVVSKLDGTHVPRQRKPKEEPAAKKQKIGASATSSAAGGAGLDEAAERAAMVAASRDANNPPGLVLKSDGISDDVNQKMLEDLFGQYPGMKEVRFIAGKGVAFVEFFTVNQATTALQGLRNFSITPSHRLRLNFAKQG
jgi:RNA recognition motif-containing protein